jgi:acetyl-CoA synthetase|uniref:Acetyl-coenzyme A synthetase n=1 Tax=Candidatus Actinomarina minuta TaxID=1389454 RepID=S5DQJ1_9ACTN|nr:acyl-coenzyme A synthetases/AMP-(fatty) acid ligases [Candidatus Actinomarina minuta]|tara:strand:- start:535 stop:2481 length:1947 start_codon:yes stop_codon:yes gene_type:complete
MSEKIENLLGENRTFDPPSSIVENANATKEWFDLAEEDRLAYWQKQALERITWYKEPTEILDDSNAPFYKWFKDGELNLSYNCLDRHLETDGDRVAFYWEGEPGDTQEITYQDLYERVCKLSNGLKELGVKKGDRIAIYLGMTPEIVISMLACARIGAVHSVVFGGFSAEALADRINDAEAKVVITADGAWRRGDIVPLKKNVDDSLKLTDHIESVVVVKRTNNDVDMVEGLDYWYHDLVDKQDATCEPEVMNAEDMLYILYTSGTTAKPKGIVHTQAGYLTGVTTTHSAVFDVKEDDIYWCAADCGWVTGHSYIVYGPLANKTTSVMYEGAPNAPDEKRLWSIVEKYKVNIFYTAPTAIRAFMKWGVEHPQAHDLSSLRLLGTVGEPINPEAWMWYHENIGSESCAIVDTWWQTETGSIMITPLPGITSTKPGSACGPMPGIDAIVVDEKGNEVSKGEGGYLAIKTPWPSMLRTVFGDEKRYIDTYWSKYDGMYFAGDGAKYDDDGYFWLLGRVDDVMNISGHRISTAEVESALVAHESVAEAAVIGRADEISGEAIAAFVTLIGGFEGNDELITTLRQHVSDKIGPIAKPKSIVITNDLPKTRSGKIMRRLLKDISEERKLGDVTTLANADIVSELQTRSSESADE